MKANAVLALLFFTGACQSPERIDSGKPYTVAMSYVADCPLSVKSSGVWLDLTQNLPPDSFDCWLFVGDSDRPLSAHGRFGTSNFWEFGFSQEIGIYALSDAANLERQALEWAIVVPRAP